MSGAACHTSASIDGEARAVAAKRKVATPGDVREACVAAAHAFIARHGVERLSLREVARELGVSHQAPYKHYASRDDLLAEVIARCFARFTSHLEARRKARDPQQDLEALGAAYLDFALRHPLEYRLMFATPWPEGAVHAGLDAGARAAFAVLRDVLARREPARGPQRTELDALLVWSSMHGLASVLQGDVMRRLSLPRKVLDEAARHILVGMRRALALDDPVSAAPAARSASRRRPS